MVTMPMENQNVKIKGVQSEWFEKKAGAREIQGIEYIQIRTNMPHNTTCLFLSFESD